MCPELPARIRRWLDGWPVPFADEAAAREFFASQGLAADPWSQGLERRRDGLWPAFDIDVMARCISDLAARDYWNEWRAIECPTLIVRGERGYFDERHCAELAESLRAGRAVTIPAAGHDVHLDAPEELATEIRRFLG
jgi:pimeloyl-ACP methyl ester carboxylesterase